MPSVKYLKPFRVFFFCCCCLFPFNICLLLELEPCIFMHHSLESLGTCSPHLILMNIVLLVITALSRRLEEVQALRADSIIHHLFCTRLPAY